MVGWDLEVCGSVADKRTEEKHGIRRSKPIYSIFDQCHTFFHVLSMYQSAARYALYLAQIQQFLLQGHLTQQEMHIRLGRPRLGSLWISLRQTHGRRTRYTRSLLSNHWWTIFVIGQRIAIPACKLAQYEPYVSQIQHDVSSSGPFHPTSDAYSTC